MTSSALPYQTRLTSALGAPNAALCVGIDPHLALLEQWGLSDDANGLESFGLAVVDAVIGRAAIVKPQVSFFERHGAAGFRALETVLVAARAAGLLVIADAKRGDIGSTNDGYGAAWLTAGSALEVDALTVSPFLGIDSLSGLNDVALANGKGLFVLCATSNPEAAASQQARLANGRTVAAEVEERVHHWNGSASPGAIGLVVGATIQATDFDLAFHASTPVLAPGFGAQGAQLSQLRELYPANVPVVASVSRSVLRGGKGALPQAIDIAQAQLAG